MKIWGCTTISWSFFDKGEGRLAPPLASDSTPRDQFLETQFEGIMVHELMSSGTEAGMEVSSVPAHGRIDGRPFIERMGLVLPPSDANRCAVHVSMVRRRFLVLTIGSSGQRPIFKLRRVLGCFFGLLVFRLLCLGHDSLHCC